MKLILLLLAIGFFHAVESRFSCPKELDCYCYANVLLEHEYRIHCNTGSSSSFDLTIQPKEMVRIQCKNDPDWSDFLLGSAINVGPIKRFIFASCKPPGVAQLQTDLILKQMNVSGIEYLKYEHLQAQLTYTDLEAFPELRYLALSNNNLGKIDSHLLRGLAHLKQLELRNAHLQIPNGLFNEASSLKSLELSDNHLKTLKPGVFDGLKKLELLNLWQNDFSKFHHRLFRNLSALISLDIHQNNLTSLPDKIFADLKNLQIINFSSNNFSSLPEGLFKHNPKLKIVKLLYNKAKIGTLPNRLLANLTNLRAVSFLRSRIMRVPHDLFWASTALIDLNLNRNYLTTLPIDLFRDTVELHSFTTSFNDLNHLPDGIFRNTKKMVKLDLSKNYLKYIKAGTLVGLESLQELNMENNKLVFIDVDAFNSLTQLKVAKFANNKLTLQTNLFDYFGHVSPFHPCKAIEELYLSHNNISEMYGDWIISSSRLRQLDLSYNSFEYIETADLQFFSERINVDLSHNSIRQISFEYLEYLATKDNSSSVPNSFNSRRNFTLHLEANPIECDCDIHALLRFIKGQVPDQVLGFAKLVDLEKLSCADPAYRKETKLIDLDPSTFKCRMEKEAPGSSRDNSCTLNGECDCWLRPADKTLTLDCSNRNLTNPPKLINLVGIDHVEIDLSINNLNKAPDMTIGGYEKVRSLNLSKNAIGLINESLISRNLRILNLEGNNLTSIDLNVLEKISNSSDISKLTLYDNPWRCDCLSLELISFLQSNFLDKFDLYSMSCANNNISLSTLSAEDLCPVKDQFIIYSLCLVSLLLIFIMVFGVLYCTFQRSIKVWLYSKKLCMCLVSDNEMDCEMHACYDAFISYSANDEEFVLKELVSRLEAGPEPYRLCVYNRDSDCRIPAQIARSVELSRRTMIVLTPNYINSVWTKLECQDAVHKQALKERRKRVIVVINGEIGPIENLDPQLRGYLELNTHIKWADPWFWQKVRYAMPHLYLLKSDRQKQNESLAILSKAVTEKKIQQVKLTFIDEIDKSNEEIIKIAAQDIGSNVNENYITEN